MDFRYVNRVCLGLKSHILTNIQYQTITNNKTEYYPVHGCPEAINNNTRNLQIVQVLGQTESAFFEKNALFE